MKLTRTEEEIRKHRLDRKEKSGKIHHSQVSVMRNKKKLPDIRRMPRH